MTLRIMLLGLVASLGFDLPSETDVASWAKAGTAWVRARLDDSSGPEVEVKLDLAGPSDCQQAGESFEVPALAGEVDADADMAFAAVSETLVSDLSADLLASHRDERPGDEPSPILASVEPMPVELPEDDEPGCVVALADEAMADAVEAEAVESMEEAPERLDRVSSAVRLTREAIQAWAELMQPAVEECHPTR